MRYTMIVECENGLYWARIPSLAELSAEGTTLEEAIKGAQQEATSYLSRVAVATIEVDLPELHLGNAQAWLDAAGDPGTFSPRGADGLVSCTALQIPVALAGPGLARQ